MKLNIKTKDKNGITLVALVVTIIVLILLAGVSINLVIGNNGIITKAQVAKTSTELAKYKEELSQWKINKKMEDNNFVEDTLSAGKNNLTYGGVKQEGNIKTIIQDLDDSYLDEVEIIKGELIINTTNKSKLEGSKVAEVSSNPYIIKEGELKFEYNKPYKLCTFSRVIYEKGIEDAIQVVRKINEEYNKIIYELDIYGPIDEEYKDRFTTIVNNAPEYIQYKGCIDSEKSVNTLKNYYLLLFPTKFKTEGIPGTIIDALSAGVPIIASRWDNVEEIISHEKNGLIYDFNDLLDFKINLEKMINTKSIKNMKKECLIEAKKFQKENVIERFVKEF